MTIRYQCEECGAVLNIKDELAGSQGHCPRCQVEFVVPAAAGSAVAEKKPAAVAGNPAVERRERSEGGFNEDDIGDILASGGSGSSTAQQRDSGNDFDDEDNDPDEEPRKKGRKPRHLDDASEAEDEETADDEDDGDSDRGRKKNGKRSVKAAIKTDSAESASIARNLMGRGEHAAVRDEKKAGRPFGGTDGRGEERPDYTSKDIIKHIASIGWPAVVGIVVVAGLSWGIIYSLSPKLALPPLADVSGTITLDGKPLEKAIVRFQPAVEGPKQNLNLATSFGFTDESGRYSLTYLVIDEKRIPGAVIGNHLVVIQATDTQGLDLLPLHYSNTSKSILKKEVVKGGPPINFDLKSDPEPSP
jgi:hypothetical protein